MDSQTKRTLLATLLCMVVVFGWIEIQRRIYPPSPVADGGNTSQPAVEQVATTSPTGPAAGELQLVSPGAEDASIEPSNPVELGDDHQDRPSKGFVNDYRLKLVLDPRGASVRTVTLADYRAHVAENPRDPDHDPYVLLRTVEAENGGRELRSFETQTLRVGDSPPVQLSDTSWKLREERTLENGTQLATFLAQLRRNPDEPPIFEIEKTYAVPKGSHVIQLTYNLKNLTDRPQKVSLTELGPVGIERADIRYDQTRAMIAVVDDDGRMSVGETAIRSDVIKHEDARARLSPGEDHLLWSALSNKYFTCIVDPRPRKAGSVASDYVKDVVAVARQQSNTAEMDLTLEQKLVPSADIPPGQAIELTHNIYFGPKNDDVLQQAAPERRYGLTRVADASMCTFELFTQLMAGLLKWLHSVFGNWGIAIIVLVIIVRLVLHPITRSGQIHMMRMQKNMARLKPKMEAIQQQYRNDRQKLNEETMKLYKTEGINPAGSILGCLPMFLQMPIWVALYTALNTDVVLRHAPFFGYIRDLSAPDAIIDFGASFNVPLLSWMMGPVRSLNLLPIFMAVVMYGQQKYMQKLTRPEKPPEPKYDKEGRPLPDQMAQQQKIMNFMMIFMGLIFYNMPSGLCLYIFCSSLLGMGEQLYIRKHLKDKDVAPDKPSQPRKPGFLLRKFEELQKTVEQARAAQDNRPNRPRGSGRRR